MKTTESGTLLVSYWDIRVAVANAIRWANESRGIPHWKQGMWVSSEEFNVKLIYDRLGFTEFIEFNSEEDYAAFLLRWS